MTSRQRKQRKSVQIRQRFSIIGPTDVDLLSQSVLFEFDRPPPPRRHTLAAVPKQKKIETNKPRRYTSVPASSKAAGALKLKPGIDFKKKGTPVFSVLEEDEEEEEDDEEEEDEAAIKAAMTRFDSFEPDEEDEESSDSGLGFIFAFGGLVGSGITANIAFEKLNAISPGCGSVFTVLQYVATVAEKAPDAKKFLTKPIIPMPIHVACVALMFFTALLGNQCLAYNLPFAQYLVIKNSNLVFSMLVGALALRRRYKWSQIGSVLLVSVGVISAVLSSQQKNNDDNEGGDDGDSKSAIIGAALCAASTLSMACLGCLQEYAFSKYKDSTGQAPAEALFYTHFLGLPFFFAGGGMMDHLSVLGGQWQRALLFGIVQVGSIVLCKQCFFSVLDQSTSLTATLAITIYRFLGVVISACFVSDKALPGLIFWLGSAAVATGSFSYLVASNKAAPTKVKKS